MTLSPCRTLQNVIQTQKCVLCREYAKPNRCVFKCFAKVSKPEEEDLKSTGKASQLLGPATAKDLKPQWQSVRWLGTTMSPWAAEWSQSRSTRSPKKYKCNSQHDKSGAEPRKHLNMIIHNLYVMRCGSQCKSIRAGVMWSKRSKPKIKRAAEFNTDCSCWTRDQGKRHGWKKIWLAFLWIYLRCLIP